MATDVERLIVTLEASTKQYERAIAKAQTTTVTALKKIERDMQASTARQQAILGRAGAGIEATLRRSLVGPAAAAATAALGVRQIIEFADSFKRMENALKVANVPASQLAGTMDDLFAVATKHGAPVEALTQLYGRLAQVQGDLNITSADLLSFTDNIGAALKVSGRSAEESRGALLQLSQALGGGVVRAEEFNAILEGALPIAQAAARGLEEAGGSVAKLRSLVIDGKVSSEAFFQAFQAGSATLQAQAVLAERTIGQAWTNIQNTLIGVIGNLDKAAGASGFFTRALDELAARAKTTGRELEAVASAGFSIADILDKLTTLAPPAAKGLNLEGLRESLEQWEKLLAIAEERGETAAAANMRARMAEIEAEIIAATKNLIGPAFEKSGRGAADAFATGFKGSVSLADHLANDLAATLDSVLADRKKEFAALIGGGGGPSLGAPRTSFAPMPQFDASTAGEQLQLILKQREAVKDLTDDLKTLETALQSHFDTPFDDVMGFNAAEGAQEAFAAAIRDIEMLSREFIDGRVSALEFDREIEALRQRLASFAGVGNELDPFIDNMLKAVGVAGQLQGQLDQTKNSITHLGGGLTAQKFTVPTKIGGGGFEGRGSGAGGTVPVIITRPVSINPDGMETAVRSGVIDLRTGLVQSIDGVRGGVRDLRTGLVTISGSVDSSAENITGAIRQQSGMLQSAFQKLSSTGPGIASGDVFTVGVVSEKILLSKAFKGFEAGVQQRADALSAEAQVLQTGLQYKQLTDKQRSEAELRLAEIEIEQAKLQENLAQATVNLTSAMNKLSGEVLPSMDSHQAVEAWQNATAAGKQMALAGDAFNAFVSTLRLMAGAKFAGGGHVRGPGGPTSDMVPIMASSGEFVVNAKQARKYRDLLEAINAGTFRMMVDGGLVARVNAAAQRMANGGMVRAVPTASIGSRDITINMTVVARDDQSFKGSQRDMIRQIAREIRAADI